MERSGYDRRKRPTDLPSTDRHRRPREYAVEDSRSRKHYISNQSNHDPRDRKNSESFRGYHTPHQDYRSPPTPDTPYQGARYASYDTPRSSPQDSHRRGPRYSRDPAPPSIPDNRANKVAWQYNIPHDNNTNQICEKYERPMDPKEFKEQCRKAYLQAAEERKRNAEMSVWGKCNWAIYDNCEGPNRRWFFSSLNPQRRLWNFLKMLQLLY